MSIDVQISAVLAVCGFGITVGLAIWKYIIDARLKRQDNQLQRINAQLRNLYGPLYALLEAASNRSRLFFAQYPDTDWLRLRQFMPEEHKVPWCKFTTLMFQEINSRMYEMIVENADLYFGSGMPKAFELFITHYVEYCAIIARWEQKDYTVLFSFIPYPERDMEAHVKEAFQSLKKMQFNILGERYQPPPPKKKGGYETRSSEDARR